MIESKKIKEKQSPEIDRLKEENTFLRETYDRDRIKRNEAENNLIVSELRYRRLFESAKDGILILDAETGKIVDVNPFLVNLLGYSKEQFIEKTIWEIGFFKDIAANQDNFIELQEKEYVRYEDLPLETFDGRKISVEFVSNVYLVNNHKVIQCNIRDITVRKQEEKIQHQINLRLELAMQVANMAWWEMDIPTGNVTFEKRKASMLGYSSEQFNHYRDFMALVHPDDFDKTMNAMQNHLNGLLDKYEVEYRIKAISGKYKWFFDIGTITKKDLNGTPQTIAGIVIDINERKRTEEELAAYRNHLEDLVHNRTNELDIANDSLKKEIEKEKDFELMLKKSLDKEKELNEMKSRFISTTSHEFRTPLTSILSSAGLLNRYGVKWSQEKKNEHFERIQNSVLYLTDLLDDVLIISKAEAGMIGCNPVQVNLKEFALECINESRSLTKKHQIILSFNASRTKYLLDPKLMKFVINNLFSNAIKYSPENSKVELAISTKDDFLIMEVSDKGVGMTADESRKIFDSFYRNKSSENIAGTGLGLAIVKHAVDLHSGDIQVNSKLGIGTTFIVRIPIINND